MHATQLLCATLGCAFPASHSVHALEPAVLYSPAGQSLHPLIEEVENFPRSQAVQVVASTDNVSVVDPAPQKVQSVAPAWLYLAGVHEMHDVSPLEPWNFPAGQMSQ